MLSALDESLAAVPAPYAAKLTVWELNCYPGLDQVAVTGAGTPADPYLIGEVAWLGRAAL